MSLQVENYGGFVDSSDLRRLATNRQAGEALRQGPSFGDAF